VARSASLDDPTRPGTLGQQAPMAVQQGAAPNVRRRRFTSARVERSCGHGNSESPGPVEPSATISAILISIPIKFVTLKDGLARLGLMIPGLCLLLLDLVKAELFRFRVPTRLLVCEIAMQVGADFGGTRKLRQCSINLVSSLFAGITCSS
jgi:hypothetical protein